MSALLFFIETMIYSNPCPKWSEDPNQTPLSATSDLGVHCLPKSILWILGKMGSLRDIDILTQKSMNNIGPREK